MIYREIEVVGKSRKSWERAIEAAVARAQDRLADLTMIRFPGRQHDDTYSARVVELGVEAKAGKIVGYTAVVKLSFDHTPSATQPAPRTSEVEPTLQLLRPR